jgi:NDP-sugar pyrophosphorylase family protein
MAGGEGKRLKPVTGSLPKPMVPLVGKPLMERIIELLHGAGITEICAALKYNPQPIIDHFGDGSRLGVHLEYRLEGEPLGTAGGVRNCADFYGTEDFIVISGDAACDFDLHQVIDAHKAAAPAVTMALYENSEPLSYGLVLPESDGAVRCFIEKPTWDRVITNLVNTGIYIVSPRAMDFVPAGVPFDFAKDLFPLLMERGEQIRGEVMEGYWCDVGTPRAYYQCCLDALDGKLHLPDIDSGSGASAPSQVLSPLAGVSHTVKSVACGDRAKLMRAVSESMMAFGADFSEGLTMRGRHCGLRVSPSGKESAVLIEAASDSAEFSAELALTMEKLVAELESSGRPPASGGKPG